MPQMGVSVAEGTIVEWRKRPGDWVEADEPVCDVTTDKVDVEIPSPASGRLERILVEPGTTVAVGTPLAEIDAAARPGEAHPQEALTARSAQPAAREPVSSAEERRAAGPAAPAPQGAASGNGGGRRIRIYPPPLRRERAKHQDPLRHHPPTLPR